MSAVELELWGCRRTVPAASWIARAVVRPMRCVALERQPIAWRRILPSVEAPRAGGRMVAEMSR